MFVNKEQLAYLLDPADYLDPEIARREVETLFLAAWHPVALTTDFRADGDYRSLDLCGRPVLVRRHDGRLHAYLNVCSHRHCQITSRPQGHDPRLVCQYHGWEYGPDGKVAKVPDGGCFKPFDRENARLQCFAVDTCGELVFVRLAPTGPTLAEYLGEFHARIAAAFAPPYRCNWTYARDFACNWKIPVENTVETYHLPFIHPTTLGGFGLIPEEAQAHWLEDRSTTLVYSLDPASDPVKKQRQVSRQLGGPPCHDQYVHHHVFPNLVFTFADLFTYAQVYLPTGPTTSRTVAWMFSLEGEKRGPLARIIAHMVARHGVKANSAIQREDASVFEAQQRGIAATPFKGCIGTREERIWAFHGYLKRALAPT